MAHTNTTSPTHRLHLTLAGWVPDEWAQRFEGLTLRHASDGSTVICGALKDQSALFGILRCIENRGLKVIACFAYPGGLS